MGEAARSTPPTAEEVRGLIKEVKAGVPGAIGELRRCAMADPGLVIRQTFGDIVKLAYSGLLLKHVPNDRAIEEGVRAKVRLVIEELSGDGPVSPARKLCIEVVAYNWLELWCINFKVGSNELSSPAWIRRQSASHKRLMSSLRTVAQIARLEAPRPRPIVATQINVSAPAGEGWPPPLDRPGELPAFPGKS
jgi:hypothetical protein